jgi:hypothetical protein
MIYGAEMEILSRRERKGKAEFSWLTGSNNLSLILFWRGLVTLNTLQKTSKGREQTGRPLSYLTVTPLLYIYSVLRNKKKRIWLYVTFYATLKPVELHIYLNTKLSCNKDEETSRITQKSD